MYDKLMSILMDQDEITWKSLIYDLIKTEQMDPWNIDISNLTGRYIEVVKKISELNLRVSGKVLLAAAILLRIKSTRLIGADLMEFDRLLASRDDVDDLYDSDDEGLPEDMRGMSLEQAEREMKLIPRTPQPRKRKVSVFDLVDALAIALNVTKRRVLRTVPEIKFSAPEKKVDISQLMEEIYFKVCEFFVSRAENGLTFNNLCPSENKEDKVLTFIPLLHLSNSRKIDLSQKQQFGDINIHLVNKG